jgi:hypothetical protein
MKLKLTGGDAKDIMNWTVSGLVVGALYQMTSIWMRQKSNSQDLNPLTEALVDDDELFSLFCQLQEHRTVDEVSFRRAVDDADRLVFLHMQLRSEQVKASMHDRANAFLYLKSSLKYLEILFQNSRTHVLPRVPVTIHKLYVLIFTCLEKHWNAILHLTQDIHHI